MNKYATPNQITIDQSNDMRVLRGGSYYDDQDSARVAYREANVPGLHVQFYGFRVVCLAPSQDD